MDEWNYLLKIFTDLKKDDDFKEEKQSLEDILEKIDKNKDEKESERKKYITVSDILKDLEKDKDKEIDEQEICDTIDILHSDDIDSPINPIENLPQKYDIYDYEKLIFYLKKLGTTFWNADFIEKEIRYLISRAIIQKASFLTDDTIYQVSVEKQIVAIAFNQFIEEPEKELGRILDLNPELFYAVSGPFSTVVLLDTRRWVLESRFSLNKGEEDTIWHL